METAPKQRCDECHSHARKIKGGLELDSRSGWRAGGNSASGRVPGCVAKSWMIGMIPYGKHGLAMPLKAKRPDAEIAALERQVPSIPSSCT
jgi:hypothetical protein